MSASCKSRGKVIHWDMKLLAPHQIDEPAADYSGLLAEAIECFANLGVIVHLTELDMSVAMWGISADRTWLNHFPVKGRTNWPLMFDADGHPKPALWRVINARPSLGR